MNKNLIFGIGIAVIIGLVIFFRGNTPQTKNPLTLKKEIKVGTDVCGEFSKDWVQSTIKKTIIKTEKLETTGTNTCTYFIDDNNFITLRLNNLSFENQKTGQQALGRSIKTNNKISLDHFIAVQENNLINDIILEINPNLFLAVDRSSTKAASETEILDFAIKVAERIKNGENQGLVSVPSTEPTKSNGVPLPLDTDIINSFFSLIETKRPSDAVMMMASSIINNDSEKQAWAVQFNAINSLKVLSVEPSMKEEWTDTKHSYKLTLDATMNPNSANEPIPYFGWENGQNIRWVTLVKEGKMWRIEGLATGP
ncbi:MAG: hypothetical protein WCT22_02020 [Patescibacteria group bacterium]